MPSHCRRVGVYVGGKCPASRPSTRPMSRTERVKMTIQNGAGPNGLGEMSVLGMRKPRAAEVKNPPMTCRREIWSFITNFLSVSVPLSGRASCSRTSSHPWHHCPPGAVSPARDPFKLGPLVHTASVPGRAGKRNNILLSPTQHACLVDTCDITRVEREGLEEACTGRACLPMSERRRAKMVKKAAQATPNRLLRAARKEHGWTQQQVADRIGAPFALNI